MRIERSEFWKSAMREPSFADALRVLLLQAADEGRGAVLFGDSLERASREIEAFMVGETFPSVYLECPLVGDPFLDVTMLYSDIKPGTFVAHPAADGTRAMFDWFAGVCTEHPSICCGFELDTQKPELPAAAVHFQPREETALVRPFCETLGEPERADLYLNQAARMPEGWSLSFFGMFRGRPGSPLRVCGYMNASETATCADDPRHLAHMFDQVGFSAYDTAMLEAASAFLAAASGLVDFQFDVFPDGSLGDVFAIDVQFEIEQPGAVRSSFESGRAGRIMRLFEERGIVDGRWRLVPQAAFARSLPVEREDGSCGKYGFTLMPQWAKARWRAGELQPAKLYFLASAGFVDKDG